MLMNSEPDNMISNQFLIEQMVTPLAKKTSYISCSWHKRKQKWCKPNIFVHYHIIHFLCMHIHFVLSFVVFHYICIILFTILWLSIAEAAEACVWNRAGNWSRPDLQGTKKKLWQLYPPHVALKSLNRAAQEDHRAPPLPVEMIG